jgi:hypothetical protein
VIAGNDPPKHEQPRKERTHRQEWVAKDFQVTLRTPKTRVRSNKDLRKPAAPLSVFSRFIHLRWTYLARQASAV